MPNSGSTWGWCLLEGIKNLRLAFSRRLISCLIHYVLWEADLCMIHWVVLPFLGWSCSENILAAIKTMDLSSTSFRPTQSYWSNIFSSLECTWIGKLFYKILFFWKDKTNLTLLLISPSNQIKQLSPYASLPNLPSVGIKLSNRFLFSKFYNRNWKAFKSVLNSLTWCWSIA